MFLIISSEPILPNNVKKELFESNKQYRTYTLWETMPDGSEKPYFIPSRNGKTHFYNEEFVNEQWIYRDIIPYDAYVKYIGEVRVI